MSIFEKATFCIDSIPGIQFTGFHDGSDWNGFACPYFERKVAEQVLDASVNNGFIWSYNTAEDTFEVRLSNEPSSYEPEIFEGQEIVVEDQQIHVYPIGAYSWIWGMCEQ